LPVRRKANAKISPIATTPAAPTQPSPDSPNGRPQTSTKAQPLQAETDTIRERVLRVSPKQEFFKQATKTKRQPTIFPTQQLFAMQRNITKGIPAKGSYQPPGLKLRPIRRGSPARTIPESASNRQPINTDGSALDLSHNDRRAKITLKLNAS